MFCRLHLTFFLFLQGRVLVQEVIRGFAAWHNGVIEAEDLVVSIGGRRVEGIDPDGLRKLTIGDQCVTVCVIVAAAVTVTALEMLQEA